MAFAPSGASSVTTYLLISVRAAAYAAPLALNLPATVSLTAGGPIALLRFPADLNLGGELAARCAVGFHYRSGWRGAAVIAAVGVLPSGYRSVFGGFERVL